MLLMQEMLPIYCRLIEIYIQDNSSYWMHAKMSKIILYFSTEEKLASQKLKLAEELFKTLQDTNTAQNDFESLDWSPFNSEGFVYGIDSGNKSILWSLKTQNLQNLINEEVIRSQELLNGFSGHNPGKYERLLEIILKHINFIKERQLRMSTNFNNQSQRRVSKEFAPIVELRTNLIFTIEQVLCVLKLDKLIDESRASLFPKAKKQLYSVHSGYMATEIKTLHKIKSALYRITETIFDYSARAEQMLVKIYQDYKSTEELFKQLSGLDQKYLIAISGGLQNINQILNDKYAKFPPTLEILISLNAKLDSQKKLGSFSLESNTAESDLDASECSEDQLSREGTPQVKKLRSSILLRS